MKMCFWWWMSHKHTWLKKWVYFQTKLFFLNSVSLWQSIWFTSLSPVYFFCVFFFLLAFNTLLPCCSSIVVFFFFLRESRIALTPPYASSGSLDFIELVEEEASVKGHGCFVIFNDILRSGLKFCSIFFFYL